MDEALPFALSPEARRSLVDFLKWHELEYQKKQQGIHQARSLPALIWSKSSKTNDVEIGPEIAVGFYHEPPNVAGSQVLIGGHVVWIDKPTMDLLRGRTLVYQQRSISGLTYPIHCYWVDPEPNAVGSVDSAH